MEWGKEEEREREKAGVVEVENVAWKTSRGKTRGRIICFKADVGGKIGSKVRAGFCRGGSFADMCRLARDPP